MSEHQNLGDSIRNAITSADDTGMIAGEELITEVETRVPPVPTREELHAALPDDHPAHATIDALHDELRSPNPDPDAIANHVQSLRLFPQLEASLANFWDDPRWQRFVSDLGQVGL